MQTLTLATLRVILKAETDQYRKETEKIKKNTDDTKKSVTDFGGVVKGVMGGVAVAAAGAAAMAMAEFGRQSLEEFKAFDRGMREVFTLMPDMSASASKQMEADIMEFSRSVGRVTDETIPALYQSISAGVPSENVFEFMQVASDAALGGVTDLETAVDGLTSVVNAYGTEVISVQQASDVMFTAVKLGKTDFEQLSASLFNVIPTAASLGVGFDDVAASLAALTAQGTPTSVATTQLRQAFIEASQSGTKLDRAIRQLHGDTFANLMKSGKSSVQVFSELRDSMPEQEFRDLFGSVEASNAVLGITNQTGLNIIETFGTTADTMGATAKAAAEMADSMQHMEDKAAASAEALRIETGKTLEPAQQGWLKLRTAVTDYLASDIALRNQINTSAEALDDYGYSAQGALRTVNALGEGNGFWRDSMVRADELARRTDAAVLLLQAGFKGTSEELAAAAIAMAKFGQAQQEVLGGAPDHYFNMATNALEPLAVETKSYEETLRDLNVVMGDYGHYTEMDTREMEEMAYASGELAGHQEHLDAVIAQLKADTEAKAEADRLAAEAAREHQAAMGGLFSSTLDAKDEVGLYTKAISDLGTSYYTTNGRTSDQERVLSDLRDEYAKAQESLTDYQIGVAGLGLTEEERAEKIQEQIDRMAQLEGAMQPLTDVTGEVIAVTNEAVWNTDALTQSLYESATAAGAGPEALAILAAATGDFTDAEIEAAFQAAVMQNNIQLLAEAVAEGSLTADDAVQALGFLQSGEADAADKAIYLAQNVDAANIRMLEGKEAALALAEGINNLPESKNFTYTFKTDMSGFTLPPGVSPEDVNITDGGVAFASGGFTGGRADDIVGYVHGQEYVFSAPAVAALGLDYLESLHQSAQSGMVGSGTSINAPITVNAAPGMNEAALGDRVAWRLGNMRRVTAASGAGMAGR
jgi:TP901 family phage tail tape measure protein